MHCICIGNRTTKILTILRAPRSLTLYLLWLPRSTWLYQLYAHWDHQGQHMTIYTSHIRIETTKVNMIIPVIYTPYDHWGWHDYQSYIHTLRPPRSTWLPKPSYTHTEATEITIQSYSNTNLITEVKMTAKIMDTCAIILYAPNTTEVSIHYCYSAQA